MSKRADPPAAASVPRRRILIVDDEPDSAATMARLLARMGADVETAHDGGRAVDAVARFGPEIVLLDIGMPSIDGYETARRIRENSAGRMPTLVALTGWARDDDLRRARDAGFDHHLAKPVDPAALERLLASAPGADALRDRPDDRTAPAAAATGLVAEMSHEIRTPLNTIAAAARLLSDSRLDEDQRELVRMLGRSSDALCAIVDDLIDLAGIESGTFALEASPFCPRAVVDECIALVGADAAARHVEFFRRAETPLPATVVGDALRVRRVTLLLLKSALRFAAHGSVMVTVSSRPAPDGRAEIHVGTSATPRNATSPPRDETAEPAPDDAARGVGFRAARILCERMGGRMWTEREPGRGRAFHFTFSALEAPASGVRGGAPSPAARLRVLVADDDPVVRRMAVLLLSHLGFAADAVASGREALSAVSRTRYDAVLLDARMPGEDGADVLREVRRVAPPPLGPASSR